MSDSRISGLHRLDIATRLDRLAEHGWLTEPEAQQLKRGQQVLRPAAANKMIENVIGVFGLPLAIAPNFIVNGRDYVVPMVVEEPSVVAALSNAARQARPAGFFADTGEWLLAGQVHVTAVADIPRALADLQAGKTALLDAANAVHPRLSDYGGGVRDLAIETLDLGNETAIAAQLLVDTGNAMGANIVNTICESIAPAIGDICKGQVALRILSNLADRSLVTARVNYTPEALAIRGFSGEEVRDRIVQASDIALADPYRAATHNKGIMNGVDAVAIATGNDWRAIEAGAHAYAAASGSYRPLAVWHVASDGGLQGELEMPLRVATVGGTLRSNPAAAMALQIISPDTSRELAQLMAAVGLAQNFAAVKALVTNGIQEGHMRMHARSAGRQGDAAAQLHEEADGSAAGKVILLGEHAAVFGKHALALPIADSVTAKVIEQGRGESAYVDTLLKYIKQQLGIENSSFAVDVRSELPPGMGLGVSAAIAVAIIRAINRTRNLGMDDDAINGLAFLCEEIAHGSPSGIDNTVATYAIPILFNNAKGLEVQQLDLPGQPPLLVAFSSQRGSTLEQVGAVRARHALQPRHYDALFDAIDQLSMAGAEALQAEDYQRLGALMNIDHGLLNAIGVSTPELEDMVAIARSAGAIGAKLTGSGGGGAIVALCPGTISQVTAALAGAGYETLSLAAKEEK